jgi:hypothetical protein
MPTDRGSTPISGSDGSDPDSGRRDSTTTTRTTIADQASPRYEADRTPTGQQVAEHQRAAGIPQDRKEAVARQKEQYGGIKFGSAFFGWLTATGTAVLLTALLAAAGTAVGVATDTTLSEAGDQATSGSATAETIGWVGGIALLVILFVAYYCGGYVAGRMARFNGLRQGVAVWLWAVLIAVVVAVFAAAVGDKYDVLSKLNSFPRIPISTDNLTTGGVIALAAVAVSALIGAILGGLAGMRFHRKVDKAAFQPQHD